jgi:hypothetical protein
MNAVFHSHPQVIFPIPIFSKPHIQTTRIVNHLGSSPESARKASQTFDSVSLQIMHLVRGRCHGPMSRTCGLWRLLLEMPCLEVGSSCRCECQDDGSINSQLY